MDCKRFVRDKSFAVGDIFINLMLQNVSVMKKINNPYKDLEGYFCFGCAPDNEAGVKMEFYEDGDEIVSFWKPESKYQGWLNTLHGGIQSVLIDEICAWVVMRKLQTTGVTSKMEVRYLKPVSTLDSRLMLRAKIVNQVRNLVVIEAGLYDSNNELCSKGVCTYFTFSQEKARNEMYFRDCTLEED